MRRPGVPPLLRERTFRRFWIGQTVSLFGDEITLLAIPLVGVVVLDASAAEMGYLTAVAVIPSLLFSMYAGVWLDRRGRRRQAMIGADLVRAALLLSIPLAYLLDLLSMSQLYLVAFAVGTCDVIFFLAYSTLFVSIVQPGQYIAANSLLNGSRSVASVGGKGIAGGLVALVTAPGALVADAVSYLVSATFLSSIRPVEPPAAPRQRGDLLAGVRFIKGSPVVRSVLGATATVNYFNFVFHALFVLFAVRELHISAAALGLVLGAAGVGAIVGTIITTPVTRRIGVGPAFALSCVLFPAPLLLVPAASGPLEMRLLLVFVAEFGAGVGVLIMDITAGSIFAAVIPDELRARVSGAYRTLNYGVRPLGAVTGGVLGSWIGLRPTLWIATAGAVACVLWALTPAVLTLRSLAPTEETGDHEPLLVD